MKRLIALLMLMALPAWAATEYLRPTSDSDPGWLFQCGSTNYASSSMSAVYSSKSGAGPTGSSAGISAISSMSEKERLFTSWQTTSKTYSALVISISMDCTVGVANGGSCNAYYSTNGGSTWTSFASSSISISQTTFSATITGATLSSVKVGVCTADQSGSATQNIYDAWTAGTYTGGYVQYGYPTVVQ